MWRYPLALCVGTLGLLCLAFPAFSTSDPLPPIPCESHPEHQWCNTSLPFEKRVDAAVAAMTLDEMIVQVSTFTPKNITPGIPRLDWPPFPYHSEGLHGLRNSYDTMHIKVTVFPQVTAMAATGNMSLVAEMSSIMGIEARALNNEATKQSKMFPRGAGLFYWSPTMNLCRAPQWGRFQESISEDPFLNGIYSATFVRSFQGNNPRYLQVAATCKHMAAYSLEGYKGHTRHNFNAVVSEQDLIESYLPAFKACITQGRPAQIMCSYNEINGVPSCADYPMLTELLRGRWGYDGLVVSDEGAVSDIFNDHHYAQDGPHGVADAINAGTDQNDGPVYAQYLGNAIKQGLTNQSIIERSLKRILLQRFRVGAFDPPSMSPWKDLTVKDIATEAHQRVAYEAGVQAVVLLNNSANVLPLNAASIKSMAIVGPMASSTRVLTGGKPDYTPPYWISLGHGITNYVSSHNLSTQITIESGCSVKCTNTSDFPRIVNASKNADVTLVAVGIDGSIEHESADRTRIDLPGNQSDLIQQVFHAAKGPVIVLLFNGGPVAIDWVKANVPTVIEAMEAGESAGDAIAALLFGDESPSGALPFTVYPASYADDVDFLNMSMRANDIGRTYRFYRQQPLWPFGFGLSYTTFKLGFATAPKTSFSINNQTVASFSVSVTNTGKRAGSKVVHAFISELTPRSELHPWEDTHDYAPLKSLWSIQKVRIAAGQTQTLNFTAPILPSGIEWCTFCTVTSSGGQYVAPGQYRITFGVEGVPDTQIVSTNITLTGDAVEVPF